MERPQLSTTHRLRLLVLNAHFDFTGKNVLTRIAIIRAGALSALAVALLLGETYSLHAATRDDPQASSCSSKAFDTVHNLSQAASAISCDCESRQLLVVGDTHGSNEIPAFVAQLVSDASRHRPVRLGLELASFEQKRINTYVRSRGTAKDRTALLHDGYWSAPDGRESKAMVRLIESVRKLRAEGRNVEIFTMVPPYPDETARKKAGGVSAFKNSGMAQVIRHQLETGKAHQLVIAYMGNAHARYDPAARGSTRSTIDLLTAYHPYLLKLAVHGKAWNCEDGTCGVHTIHHFATSPTGHAMLRQAQRTGPVTRVWVRMPSLTASAPAKQKQP